MTNPEERIQRIKDRWNAQAAETSLPELAEKLAGAHSEVIRQLAEVSPAQAAYKPSPEEWSINEVVAHLCSSNASVQDALGRALSGETVETRLAMSPAAGPLDALTKVREDSHNTSRLLKTLCAGPEPEFTIRLSPFGVLSCKASLVLMLGHTGDHSRQIANVKANPGFPAA